MDSHDFDHIIYVCWLVVTWTRSIHVFVPIPFCHKRIVFITTSRICTSKLLKNIISLKAMLLAGGGDDRLGLFIMQNAVVTLKL